MNWRSVWKLLGEELHELWTPQEGSWHEYVSTGAPAPALAQDWALGEAPHSDEIRDAIERWSIDGVWPGISEGAAYCIRMRLNAAADFVFLLSDRDYIPLPSGQTERQIARWFLLDWWPLHGRMFFATEVAAPRGDEGEE